MTALIAANWKMNASLAANEALLGALAAGMAFRPACDVALCIPAPYMAQFAALVSQLPALTCVALGAQDVSSQPSGAFTGEVSAAMLKDLPAAMPSSVIQNAVCTTARPMRWLQPKPSKLWRKASRPSSAWVKRWPNVMRDAPPKLSSASSLR